MPKAQQAHCPKHQKMQLLANHFLAGMSQSLSLPLVFLLLVLVRTLCPQGWEQVASVLQLELSEQNPLLPKHFQKAMHVELTSLVVERVLQGLGHL